MTVLSDSSCRPEWIETDLIGENAYDVSTDRRAMQFQGREGR
jgi:hypothetical protein